MTMTSFIRKFTLLLMTALSYAQPSDSLNFNAEWMNTDAHPETNFFEYANGGWLQKNQIPEDEAEWGIFDILDQQVKAQIKSMILSLPNHPHQIKNPTNRQLYSFYQSGMDLKLSEKTKLEPLQPLIDEVFQFKSLARIIAHLHALNVNVFFNLSPNTDVHYPNFMIAQISQDGMFLPNRNYYLQHDEKSLRIQKAYQRYIETLFTNSGYDTQSAHQAYLDTWFIESKLAYIAKENDYFRIPQNIDHRTKTLAMEKKYSHLQLQSYLHENQLDHLKILNDAAPSYLKELNQLLPTLSKSQIQHYLLAQLFANYAPYLHQAFREPYFDFLKSLRGTTNYPERWKQVIETENNLLGYAIGELYVVNYQQPGEIEYIENMIVQIRHALKNRIIQSKWLSKKTQKMALKKLRAMSSRVGYPKKPLNYEYLMVKEQSYVANVMAAYQFEILRQWQKMNRVIDPDEWDMPPQSINAYYDVSQNQINIPLGILQKPFFDIHAPDAINYGGIGVVIGHEIFHGFDDEGAQFDAEGKLNFWWTKEEWNIYQGKIQCIVNQFSGLKIPGSENYLNGKLVSGEAIADLGGIQLAYEALTQLPNLQDIEHFTATQQFFINFAHIWASKIRDEESIRKGHIDPHPPKIYRVNGTLSNTPQFYEAFHIPKKKRMCNLF
jgi:putative endopeptidase